MAERERSRGSCSRQLTLLGALMFPSAAITGGHSDTAQRELQRSAGEKRKGQKKSWCGAAFDELLCIRDMEKLRRPPGDHSQAAATVWGKHGLCTRQMLPICLYLQSYRVFFLQALCVGVSDHFRFFFLYYPMTGRGGRSGENPSQQPFQPPEGHKTSERNNLLLLKT